jgi:hypothetical protein
MAHSATFTAENLAGRCLCGAVRFTATVPVREFGACHCGMCRRWSAGPFLAVECEGVVAIEGDVSLGVYRSSEWAERCFCTNCGTPLFYRLAGKEVSAVSLEALNDRAGFAFSTEIFIDDKPPYYAFANVTKTMTGAEAFAAFGASGDGQ